MTPRDDCRRCAGTGLAWCFDARFPAEGPHLVDCPCCSQEYPPGTLTVRAEGWRRTPDLNQTADGEARPT